jgi:predicted RNase H-like HicB family nuclease
MERVKVIAEWDDEAKVWVARSDDVPGLVTEALTLAVLISKLRVLIPELLEANAHLADEEIRNIPVSLIAHREQMISLRD